MKPRPSIVKKQREQAKRDRKIAKAEKKAQRKTEGGSEDIYEFQHPVPVEEEQS